MSFSNLYHTDHAAEIRLSVLGSLSLTDQVLLSRPLDGTQGELDIPRPRLLRRKKSGSGSTTTLPTAVQCSSDLVAERTRLLAARDLNFEAAVSYRPNFAAYHQRLLTQYSCDIRKSQSIKSLSQYTCQFVACYCCNNTWKDLLGSCNSRRGKDRIVEAVNDFAER